MTGYTTRQLRLRFGERDLHVRALSDLQQYDDADGHAERAGISSAQWSLFGHVWPAGCLLAEAMSRHPIAGRRILELGCGLGLASLVLQQRGADVLATDHHPLAESFLHENAALNGLAPVPYRTLQWTVAEPDLGRFDLIIGSDILYERGHATQLAPVLERHASAEAEIVIADPGRGNSALLTRALAAQGYAVEEWRGPMTPDEAPPFRGRLLTYRRSGAPVDRRA
ncbi:methyltransferase [Dokdonella sp.]|uniref:class I SAM-dependent methyltransferase n=1 Tax=Dokdonella sp. TaxID=2291710 RepID=UPI001B02EE6A|nr:methyltransferase [Dokdonella sp.]MBO9662570.1 methyltransferase [Dokdonella sp.]